MKLPIPFYPQTNDTNCGPAALQMILAYFGEKIDLVKIEEAAGIEPAKGLYTIQLANAAAKLGYQTQFFTTSLGLNPDNSDMEFYKKHFENEGQLVVSYTSSGDRASPYNAPWVYALVGRAALALGDDAFGAEMISKLETFQVQDKSQLKRAFVEGLGNNQQITQFTMQESILTLQQGSLIANP